MPFPFRPLLFSAAFAAFFQSAFAQSDIERKAILEDPKGTATRIMSHDSVVSVCDQILFADNGPTPEARRTVLLLRGDQYLRLGMSEKATVDFADVLRASPDENTALRSKAMLQYEKTGDPEVYLQLQKQCPNDSFSNAYAAACLIATKPADSIAFARRAAELAPKDSIEAIFATYIRAQASLAAGDTKDSLDAANDCVLNFGLAMQAMDASELFVLRSSIYLKLGKTAQATADAEAAVKLNRDNPSGMIMLWRCLVASGLADTSLLVAKKYREVYAVKSALMPQLYAASCNITGRHAEVLSMDLGPADTGHMQQLAISHLLAGEEGKAIATLEQALLLEPKNPGLILTKYMVLIAASKAELESPLPLQIDISGPENRWTLLFAALWDARRGQYADAEGKIDRLLLLPQLGNRYTDCLKGMKADYKAKTVARSPGAAIAAIVAASFPK